MTKFTINHVFSIDEQKYWSTWFNDNTLKQIYEGNSSFSIISCQDSPVFIRSFICGLKASLPGPATKLLGSNLRFTVTETFETSKAILATNYVPNSQAEKLRVEKTTRLETQQDGLHRKIDYLIECRIFGLGGLVESSLEKAFREEEDASAKIFSHIVSN